MKNKYCFIEILANSLVIQNLCGHQEHYNLVLPSGTTQICRTICLYPVASSHDYF